MTHAAFNEEAHKIDTAAPWDHLAYGRSPKQSVGGSMPGFSEFGLWTDVGLSRCSPHRRHTFGLNTALLGEAYLLPTHLAGRVLQSNQSMPSCVFDALMLAA